MSTHQLIAHSSIVGIAKLMGDESHFFNIPSSLSNFGFLRSLSVPHYQKIPGGKDILFKRNWYCRNDILCWENALSLILAKYQQTIATLDVICKPKSLNWFVSKIEVFYSNNAIKIFCSDLMVDSSWLIIEMSALLEL